MRKLLVSHFCARARAQIIRIAPRRPDLQFSILTQSTNRRASHKIGLNCSPTSSRGQLASQQSRKLAQKLDYFEWRGESGGKRLDIASRRKLRNRSFVIVRSARASSSARPSRLRASHAPIKRLLVSSMATRQRDATATEARQLRLLDNRRRHKNVSGKWRAQ